jgi:hypothetical protein
VIEEQAVQEMQAVVGGQVLRVSDDGYSKRDGTRYNGKVIRVLDTDAAELVDITHEAGAFIEPAVGDQVRYEVLIVARQQFGDGPAELQVRAKRRLDLADAGEHGPPVKLAAQRAASRR